MSDTRVIKDASSLTATQRFGLLTLLVTAKADIVAPCGCGDADPIPGGGVGHYKPWGGWPVEESDTAYSIVMGELLPYPVVIRNNKKEDQS